MIDPAILRAMADAGASVEVIIAAVEADVRKEEERREAKRANNAERQQRFRDRRKVRKQDRNESNALRDVTPPIDINHTPHPDISPDGENQGAAPKPRRQSAPITIPADWEPVLTPAAQRTVDGWPPGMFERQVEAFRNHAADKGRKSKDWQAAFRTWITRADDWKPKNDRPSRHEPPRRDEIQNPYARAVAARQAARAGDEWGQPGSWSECG